MTTSTYRAFAEQLHAWGFNVNAIKQGSKKTLNRWKDLQTQRQDLADLQRYPWDRAAGVGVLNGPGDFHTFDIDDCPSETPLAAILAALDLPDDYPWAWRSGSGTGWGVAFLCDEPLPAGVLEEKKGRAEDGDNEKGVYWGWPGEAGGFHHLELRWQDNQTIVPPSAYTYGKKYGKKQGTAGPGYQWRGEAPTEPPARVPLYRVLDAYFTLCPPKEHVVIDQATKDAIREKFDLVAWFTEKMGGETARESGGEIRILGHGGLLVNPDEHKWYIFGEKVGGDWAEAVAFTEYQTRASNLNGKFIEVVKTAAAFAGVTLQTERAETPRPPAADEAPAPLGPTAELARALEAAGYHATLNTETDEITVNGQLLSDVTRALLRGVVRDRRLGPVGILDDALTLQAHEHRVAPIRDGLSGLEWDGQPHIARLAACLQTGAGEVITYPPGEHRRAAEVFLLRWLLGAVGRVFDGEQNAMLVLDGPQGIGKSSLVGWLGGALPGVYCEESISPQDKDCLFRLTRTLVWEAPELDAVTRRHDAAALKHFLTRSTVTARRAYGRHDITKPVLTSFIGTVNTNGNGFLPDPTGNRRYMVLTLTGLNWSYQKLDPRQVWAEAVARYRKGERGRLTAEEAAYRDRVNAEQHQTTGLMDDWLAMYFEVTGDADDLLTSGEIAAHLAGRGISLGGNDRASAMAIADALTRAGVGRAERRAALKRYGDGRRAWQGVAIRRDDDPTSPMIQPRSNLVPKVGSPHHNADYGLSDPTDPTSRREIEKTYRGCEHLPGGGAAAVPSQSLNDFAGQVGSGEVFTALEGSDPTFFEVGSRSDQVGSDGVEVGSPRPFDGNDLDFLTRCWHADDLLSAKVYLGDQFGAEFKPHAATREQLRALIDALEGGATLTLTGDD